jgi:tetratricopeptide (TPR) repeat protein
MTCRHPDHVLAFVAGLLLAVLGAVDVSAQTAACRAACDRDYGDHPGRFSACVNQCPRVQPRATRPQPSYSGGSQTDWNYCNSSTLGTAEERIRHCSNLIDGNLSPQERARAYYNRALNWYEQKDYDNAVGDFDEALKLAPNDAEYLSGRGDALRDNGDFERSIRDYSAAIRLAPTAENYNGRCFGRAAMNVDLELALSDCNEALRRKPQDGDTLDSRAFVYFRLQRFDEAMADLNEALRRNAGLATSRYVRGVIKLMRGDTAGGNADIAAAKSIQADVAENYTRWGVIPAAATPAAPPRPAPRPTPAVVPAPAPAPTPATTTVDCAMAEAHWKAADGIGSAAAYLDHLKRFPNCTFSDLARLKIEAMKK